MKIVSIEPTPSPNSMKINLNEELPSGETRNYKQGSNLESAPDFIAQLFDIEGVKGLYHVTDFIALERHPKVSWEGILPAVRSIFGSEETSDVASQNNQETPDDSFGEVKVFVQMFRGIPMQVKLEDGDDEKRIGLPDIFMEAAMEAAPASPNMIMERKWVEQNPRYGDPYEIGEQVKEELAASYDTNRLKTLVKLAAEEDTSETEAVPKQKVSIEVLNDQDWKVRYAALDRMDPTIEDLPVLDKALGDPKASIRRLATAYLGMIEEAETLPYLYKALKDKTVTVRRTAGDCLSDLGFKEAMPEMIESLSDSNRLVRWRAAMFLYELGDETALPALKEASKDPEFEVRMQINMAIERIEGGETAKGSVWHQMTQATKQKQ
ncbi:conserved virulence factor C family protein [Halobacillus shinanisalinarum]|uniref:Conserved virulence factor C family protein n=1 Tax=Halobacillus shinanisalinarum TaxID=2932258 RepID=A0ABY4GVB1_9BACI|nr:conserved virulence factor C family protein [Halobacillus shinanisalinarum]UOQ91655.1 conserved virulence factor C family protein [Halobacillus shinanisalinarum]